MAKLLALDWNQRQLRFVLANRQSKGLVVEDLGVLPLEPADGQSVYDVLQEHLKDSRFRNTETLVALRRGDAELRLMSLPLVPPEEVPDIVRMLSLKEFSEVGDDWPLDYLPLHDGGDSTKVLAALISPNRRKQYEQALSRADLRAKALVLRPTATALLVRHLDEGEQRAVELCVDDLESEIEMSVLREGIPILIRTVQSPPADDDQRVEVLCREIRRTVLAARNQLDGDQIERIVLFGADDELTGRKAECLKQNLQLPVRVLNPFSKLSFSQAANRERSAQAGHFAAAIGLLHGAAQEHAPLIDFLNPRKPAPPKSNRRLITLGAAGIAACVLAGAAGFYWTLHQMDAETTRLQLEVQNQRQAVEAAEQRLADVGSVTRWQTGDINWLDHLQQISLAIPDSQRARFTRLQAAVAESGEGSMILEGLVDEQGTIGEIDQALRGPERRVRGVGGEYEGRDEAYPWRFKETVTISPPANAAVPAPSPAGRQPRRATGPSANRTMGPRR